MIPHIHADSKNTDTTSQEKRLIDHLFKNYDKHVRPTQSAGKPINMTFGVAYVQLVELDDKEMTMISNVWIRQIWHNQLLRWNPKDFDGITKLTISPNMIWLPDIVLYNNAKSGLGGGTMYQYKTKVIIQHDGTHKWFAPAIIRSGCDVEITYFPFDVQHCLLQFGSWTYHGGELNLDKDKDTADLSFYQTSTEFELLSAIAERKVFNYTNALYPNLFFSIRLRRMPGFFLFNVIIPSMVITFFAILTFISPPLIGERIALAIESFLSLSFLCMMVADSMPVNSDVSPLITQFLVTCMTLISAVLISNMVSMNLAGSHPVPEWIRKVAFIYVGPFVGYSDGMKLRDQETTQETNQINDEENNTSKLRNGIGQLSPYNLSHLRNTDNLAHAFQQAYRRKLRNAKSEPSSDSSKKNEHFDDECPVNMRKEHYEKVKENMNDIIARSTNEQEGILNTDFWRCVAQTVDRICMMLFSISFIFLSTIMLLRGYGHQYDVEKEYYDVY